MKTTLFRILAGAAGLAMIVGTSGFQIIKSPQGKGLHWSVDHAAYGVNINGAPIGTDDSIKAAMDAWNGAGSSFRFTGGDVTERTSNSQDHFNVCFFGSMGANGVLAQNRLTYNPKNGDLIDSDIAFNTSYIWSTLGEPGKIDVQNVATHELGHSLSLADLHGSGNAKKTMYAAARPGETKKRTLTKDDIAGINTLYPP